MSITFLDVFVAFLGIYLVKKLHSRQHTPLPPGPKGYPLIGNLLDVPTGRSWLGWSGHKRLFGPISCLNIFGMHIIVLNDLQMAIEMFDKRSSIYSDRPTLVFGGEMCGWDNTLALLHYGERHRLFRKHMHQVLGTQASLSKYHNMIEVEMRRLLLRNIKAPTRLLHNIQTSAVAVILRISHGYAIEPEGPDPLVDIAEKGIAQISMAAQPGAFVVDAIPILRYIPEWFPGAAFKRTAREFKATVDELVEKPFRFVKHEIANGSASPSYTHDQLEKCDDTAEMEHIIKWSASSLYTGGADTTVSTIQTFALAMLLYPDVAKKAQAEIDAVIGPDRLPTFADRDRLPYINATVKETMRWHPVSPMGLPHVPIQDDIFAGYLIPKGSIILPNIWEFSHDPLVYADPYEFKPERFIGGEAYGGKAAEMDITNFVFGFGRRICPGNNLADASSFMAIAMTLAVFDINRAVDATGKPINVEFEFAAGTLTHPKPFQSVCTPRSAKAAALIRSVEEEHPWGSTDATTISNLDWRNPL